MSLLLDLLASAKVYDLAQPYFTGMPHHPAHPPFLFSLVKAHGEYLGPIGNSSASDAIALGSHVGTHIDALCHFSCGGKLHGGDEAASLQS
jgi:kynurenine formamidase